MLKLNAKLHNLQKEFIADSHFVNQLMLLGGSPVNVIIPEIIDDNYNDFMEVVKKHGVNSKVFFAHKVNQSQALVRRVEYLGGNVDVASRSELVGALSAGFTGNRILLNGPKNSEFIRLGIQHNCMLVIDNIEELQEVINLTISRSDTTPIIMRLALRSSLSEFIKDTRFGINENDAISALEMVKTHKNIVLKGFSFHIDTTDLNEKVSAFSRILTLIEKSNEMGFQPDTVDIGGGFKVSYLESEKEWNEYTSAIRSGILDSSKQITWNNTAYGLKILEGTLRGSENYYRYFETITGPDFLNSFLNSPVKEYGDALVADLLKDFMLTLFIEPGRSLAYNTGLTIGKVIFTKKSLKGEQLIGLDMNKSHLSSTEDELFVDPILISSLNNKEKNSEEEGVYLIGNLCQEHDLILKHKVFFDSLPAKGDLLIFPHTGAYHMDFNQTNAIKHPTPQKYVVSSKSKMIFTDESYSPYI